MLPHAAAGCFSCAWLAPVPLRIAARISCRKQKASTCTAPTCMHNHTITQTFLGGKVMSTLQITFPAPCYQVHYSHTIQHMHVICRLDHTLHQALLTYSILSAFQSSTPVACSYSILSAFQSSTPVACSKNTFHCFCLTTFTCQLYYIVCNKT